MGVKYPSGFPPQYVKELISDHSALFGSYSSHITSWPLTVYCVKFQEAIRHNLTEVCSLR